MNLIPMLAFSAADFHQAEKLLDLLALYKNKQPSGYILMVAAHDTHPEMHERMKIAASIGFEHHALLNVTSAGEGKTRYEQVNHLFKASASFIGANYRTAFLWLEPDSIPVHGQWLEEIESAYVTQPKLYLSSVLVSDDGKKNIIGRVGVYPRGAGMDIGQHFDGKDAFEIAAGDYLVRKTGKTRLIQSLPINTPEDLSKVRNDAVIVHGDKIGLLLDRQMEKARGVKVKVAEVASPIVQGVPVVNLEAQKVDGRTRAGRAAKTQVVAA